MSIVFSRHLCVVFLSLIIDQPTPGKDYVKDNLDHYYPLTTSSCDDITQLYHAGAMLASPIRLVNTERNKKKRKVFFLYDGITLLPRTNAYVLLFFSFSRFLFYPSQYWSSFSSPTSIAYVYILSLVLVFLACAYMYRFFMMTSLYIRRHSSTTTTPLFHHADDERRGEEEGED